MDVQCRSRMTAKYKLYNIKMSGDIENDLQQQVCDANRDAKPLQIIGGGSKNFYGREPLGSPLYIKDHNGIINYDPAELVVTARAGTRLLDLEKTLADNGQRFGFEPPRFNKASTIGGVVASGLAGPRRPYAGAVRDFVLGVKILHGNGDIMRFGGEVMKNVAGFDIARLMSGAMGVLGVLLEVSVRVVPRTKAEITLHLQHENPSDATALFNRLATQPLPLSAAAWCDGVTRIRLSASNDGVRNAMRKIGGEADDDGDKFWSQLRDHRLPFFDDETLLRASIPPAAEINLPEGATQLIDWGGAQRWIIGEVNVNALRKLVTENGGHVTCFRRQNADPFQPLNPALHALHKRLKNAFDPAAILNRGRLYPDL